MIGIPCQETIPSAKMGADGLEVTVEELTFSTSKTPRENVLNLIRTLAPRKSSTPLMRIGPKGDGGYLVPNDLDGIYALFSPGVGELSGFEKECASRGLKVFMADHSVEQPAEEDPDFHFTKKYVGCLDSDNMITMDSWVAASLPSDCQKDLILQMDIEGAEYESLIAISKNLLCRFRIIVVEFHALGQLWNAPFFCIASKAFEKLLQTHSCVHIHPNNCCGTLCLEDIGIPRVCEFTFLRKDRGFLDESIDSLPHELDEDNTENPPLALDPIWLGVNGLDG
jgi:hypothetical protein